MNQQRKFASTNFYCSISIALMMFTAGSAAEEKITAAEMREFIPPNTLSGRNDKQIMVHVYHDPSGKMEGVAKRQGTHYDSGNWTITDDDQYCRKWERWRLKELDCFHIYRLGDNHYRLESVTSKYDSRVKVREGNPEHLKVY